MEGVLGFDDLSDWTFMRFLHNLENGRGKKHILP
jgi:hypothetical protein